VMSGFGCRLPRALLVRWKMAAALRTGQMISIFGRGSLLGRLLWLFAVEMVVSRGKKTSRKIPGFVVWLGIETKRRGLREVCFQNSLFLQSLLMISNQQSEEHGSSPTSSFPSSRQTVVGSSPSPDPPNASDSASYDHQTHHSDLFGKLKSVSVSQIVPKQPRNGTTRK